MRSIAYYSTVKGDGDTVHYYFLGVFDIAPDESPSRIVHRVIKTFLKIQPLTESREAEVRTGIRYFFIDVGTRWLIEKLTEQCTLDFVIPSRKQEALLKIAMAASIPEYFDVPETLWEDFGECMMGTSGRISSHVFNLDGGIDNDSSGTLEEYHRAMEERFGEIHCR